MYVHECAGIAEISIEVVIFLLLIVGEGAARRDEREEKRVPLSSPELNSSSHSLYHSYITTTATTK